MSINDPIADMFTRIRNALSVQHEEAKMVYSREKCSVAKILKEEGFISYFEIVNESVNKKAIKIGLKYDDNKKPVISLIKKESLSGKRCYVKKKDIPKVLNGYGISILSTSKGIMTGRDARLQNVGGELIGIVY